MAIFYTEMRKESWSPQKNGAILADDCFEFLD